MSFPARHLTWYSAICVEFNSTLGLYQLKSTFGPRSVMLVIATEFLSQAHQMLLKWWRAYQILLQVYQGLINYQWKWSLGLLNTGAVFINYPCYLSNLSRCLSASTAIGPKAPQYKYNMTNINKQKSNEMHSHCLLHHLNLTYMFRPAPAIFRVLL